MAFHPYLNFAGTCREAFTRYQEIFGGELFVMPMSEVPEGEAPDQETFPGELIAHAALTIGDDALLMASDAPGTDVTYTHGIYVSYSAKDAGDAKKVFDALSDGGTVESALEETFFSAAFGICRDRWGVPWMIVAPGPDEG